MSNHGDRIRGTDECIMAVNHVSVTVSVRGRTKGNLFGIDTFYEGVCISKIGIGMASAKVSARLAVLGGGFRETELGLENADTVWTSDYC
jgi:hypothetical protein